jgi:glycine cleavage system H protein
MNTVPTDLHYTEKHEYLRPVGPEGEYFVGITYYAQGELGDVVFVELPSAGTIIEQMQSFGTIEAVKAVSDLYAPVSGEVLEANAALDNNPALVNTDPYGEGWMLRIRATDPSQIAALLDAEAYTNLLKNQ